MSNNYDNWERLVEVVLKREELRRIALLDDSRESSFNSIPSSSFNFGSSSNTVVDDRDSDIFQQLDASVESFLESLKQLRVFYHGMTLGMCIQMAYMRYDLRLFKECIKDSTEKRNNDATLQQLVKQIIYFCYDAEDTMNAIVARAAVNESRNIIQRYFHILNFHVKLLSLGKKFEGINSKVNDIYMNKNLGLRHPR